MPPTYQEIARRVALEPVQDLTPIIPPVLTLTPPSIPCMIIGLFHLPMIENFRTTDELDVRSMDYSRQEPSEPLILTDSYLNGLTALKIKAIIETEGNPVVELYADTDTKVTPYVYVDLPNSRARIHGSPGKICGYDVSINAEWLKNHYETFFNPGDEMYISWRCDVITPDPTDYTIYTCVNSYWQLEYGG